MIVVFVVRYLLDVYLVGVVAVVADVLPFGNWVADGGGDWHDNLCRSLAPYSRVQCATLETTPLPARTIPCRRRQPTATGWSCPLTAQQAPAHATPHKTHCAQGCQQVKPVPAEGAIRPGPGSATGNDGVGLVQGADRPGWRSAAQSDRRCRAHCSQGQVGAARNDGFGVGAGRS